MKQSLTISSLFALRLRCCERLSAINGALVIQECRHTAMSFHFKRMILVLYKNDFSTMPTPEYYKISYRRHKAEKEK